jgi:hypothetical protein
MSRQPGFPNKETFESSVKYLGRPPCFSCLVGPMCFSAKEGPDRQSYEIHLEQPCGPAQEWFAYSEFFSGLVHHLETMKSPLLNLDSKGIREEIKKIFKSFTPNPDEFIKHWFD